MPPGADELDRRRGLVDANTAYVLGTLGVPAGNSFLSRIAKSVLRPAGVLISQNELVCDAAFGAARMRDAGLAALSHYGLKAVIRGATGNDTPLDVGSLGAPRTGPLIILSNHPGTSDIYALAAAIDRDDLRILLNDAPAIRFLPNARSRVITVSKGIGAVLALRDATEHLHDGGALLIFPAGGLEPDPAIAFDDEPLVNGWKPAVSALLRDARETGLALTVLEVAVSGVTSRRALSLLTFVRRDVRVAKRLCPLFQYMTRRVFNDSTIEIHVGALRSSSDLGPDDVNALRASLEALASRARGARV